MRYQEKLFQKILISPMSRTQYKITKKRTNFYKEIMKNGQNTFLLSLTYHHLLFHSFYDLT